MRTVALCLLLGGGCDYVFHLGPVAETDGAVDGSGPEGAEAAYTFESLPSDMLLDVTSHEHTGTCLAAECPTITAGQTGHGNAGTFDGSQQVSIPSFAMSAFTVTFWMRVDSASAQICPVGRVFGLGSENSWQLCLATNGSGATFFFYTTDAPSTLQSSAVSLPLGTWHHFAIRWDGAMKTIFLDRQELVSGPGTTRFDAGPILLGRDFDNPLTVAPLTGALDDVFIYNRALTNDEITIAQ